MTGLTHPVRLASIAVLLLGFVGLVIAVKHYSGQPLTAAPDPPPPASPANEGAEIPRHPYRFTSNDECRACHLEIWEEWMDDQHSQAWFNEPLLPQDPKRTECNNCHAPQPVLEVGFEAMPLIRSERFDEGVGCIACHQRHDRVEGPLPSTEAACNPTFNATFTESRICNSCHAWHGTYEQWQATRWAEEGTTCQDCHMPEVTRPIVTGGPPRKGHSHRMRSQRDPEMLREAVSLECLMEADDVVVTLANVGAAHAVPGEIFNRELFVLTRLFDDDGALLSEARESLKTVRREQRATEASTQLQAGESRTWRYARRTDAGGHVASATVLVGYKHFYLTPDEWAISVYERTVPTS